MECYENLRRALIAIYATNFDTPPLKDFEVHLVNATQQLCNDCGVCTFHFADKIMRNEKFSDKHDIHKLRKELHKELQDVETSYLTKEKTDKYKELDMNWKNMVKHARSVAKETEKVQFKILKRTERQICDDSNNDWSMCELPEGCRSQECSQDERRLMVQWVQCVLCRKWLHEKCLEKEEKERIYKDFFRCNKCLREKEEEERNKKNAGVTDCYVILDNGEVVKEPV